MAMRAPGNSSHMRRAAESEKMDKRVESAMAVDASSVSLLSWEERIYRAVDVGRAKKTMPIWKDRPVTPNAFKQRNPIAGSSKSLKTAAARESLRWVRRPERLSTPPTDNRASGRVT